MPEKLRIGLIGAGGIAQLCHLPGYQAASDLCEIVAVADPSPEARSKSQKEFGVPKAFDDYRAMLRDVTLDAVSVTTPNRLHLEPTLEALDRGLHVLCEKPLAMNQAEAQQIVDAAKTTGKIVQVGFNWRFHHNAKFLKQFIDGGHMGDVMYARAKALRRRGVPAWGVFTNKELQGGGPLIDIGVHILDLTLHFMGYPRPVAASGQTWNRLGTDIGVENFWGDYDRSTFTVEDFAVGFVRFENGAVLSLESSFMANLEGDPFETQLFGTKAGAIWKPSGENPVRIFKEMDRQYFEMTPPFIKAVPSSHTDEIRAFLEAILAGNPSPVPPEQGFVTHQILDAIYASAESGQEVRIS